MVLTTPRCLDSPTGVQLFLLKHFASLTYGPCADYTDTPLEKPLKLVLKVGGSEVTELSGSGHDSSYYDDRSDHERERHREKKKKKKKKSEKEKHLDEEERRKRKVKVQWPSDAWLYLGHCHSPGLPGPLQVMPVECQGWIFFPVWGRQRYTGPAVPI